MERKKFITAALGAGAIIAATGIALGDTQPDPDDTDNPGGSNSPCLPSGQRFGGNQRGTGSQNPAEMLQHADRNLGRLIEMLQRDPNDYGGHKQDAIGYMQQALTQIQDALQSAGANGQSLNQSPP